MELDYNWVTNEDLMMAPYRRALMVIAVLALFVPVSVARASEVEVPQAVTDSLLPGSQIFNEALVLLTYEEITGATVTYGEPRKTTYLELVPDGSGPITSLDVADFPQRYISVQYVAGKIHGVLVVDETGEFIEMGARDSQWLSKLEALPLDGAYVTDFGEDYWISEDGMRVQALTAATEEFLGNSEIGAGELRELKADQLKTLLENADNAENAGGDLGGFSVTSVLTSEQGSGFPYGLVSLACVGIALAVRSAKR